MFDTKESIRSFLTQFVVESIDDPDLRAMVEYALLPVGKLLRPELCFMTCADFGGDQTMALPAAAALEALHCASLVHDDLPELDDDDYRRGRPSLHAKFGHAEGLLVGDFIPAWSIYVASRRLPHILSAELVKILSRGYSEVCLGQLLDIHHRGNHEAILECYRKKTGALFAAAMSIGVIAARGGEGIGLALVERVGEHIGVAYQVVNDLEDQRGTTVEHSLRGNSDARSGRESMAIKLTAVELGEMFRGTLCGLDYAINEAEGFFGRRLSGARRFAEAIKQRFFELSENKPSP